VPAKAKVLNSKVVFKGMVFNIRRDRVREPGGVVCTREIITHNGSVVLLPVFPDGSILMVRQYRHAAASYLWELVAGHIDKGERPLAAAHRELVEETGYTARRMKPLLNFFPSPGVLNERMWVYSATGLTAGAPRQEADERITARRFSTGEIEQMIRHDKIHDGKSIASILYHMRFAR
jgi:ADP-ribose pyrophosphatase